MDHLVSLDVKGPRTVGGYGIEGFVGLFGQYPSSLPQGVIPGGVDDPDFRISD